MNNNGSGNIMRVPLLDLKSQYSEMKEEILREISDICDTQYFILGERVERFEKQCAAYCGSKYACGVSSGSDALLVSLMVEGIGAGDEVVTSPFTFFATAGAIARVGATPVFVDIVPGTFNIDPKEIEKKITPKTKAIIPVHLFGQAADMDPIMKIAEEHGLVVVEDAAQAIGSEYKGRKVGSIGHYGCFSFFPSKNLGAFGDGGIVTVNDEKRFEMLKIFRNHGAQPKYYHKYIGGNFRLDALQASILSIKLKHLDNWHKKRRANADDYRELFAALSPDSKIKLPETAPYQVKHIYNQFSILVEGGKRDFLRKALLEAGIGTDIYYPVPLHLQECFSHLGYVKGDLPVSEKTADSILALPIYPESTREQREYIVSEIEKALK
jgi:dTDP-4-amino-4,6-dideoxygalactose transaminase